MTRNSLAQCVGPVVLFLVLGGFAGCSRTSDVKTESSPQTKTKIKEAMAAMKTRAAKLGEPKVVGGSLVFGTTTMNDNYQLVDSLKAEFGCVATFLVKKDEAFVRVSTNVMKDGQRAVGTQLDLNGPAIAALQKGQAFYGVADILGSRYQTGYEPIKNTAGEIIGAYFIGFPMKP